MSMQLNPTKQQLADLALISKLGTDRLGDVEEKLRELPKPLLNPQDLLALVRNLIGADAEPLMRQLLSLRGLIRRSDLSPVEVVARLRDAIEQRGEPDGTDVSEWGNVESNIEALLQDQSICLVAKAVELAYDYANLLRKTKILTDIRPLFNEAANEIEGAVVSYTMRLWYSSADSEHELSIALDESDIRSLAEECERATNKAKVARELISNKCKLPATVFGEANDG